MNVVKTTQLRIPVASARLPRLPQGCASMGPSKKKSMSCVALIRRNDHIIFWNYQGSTVAQVPQMHSPKHRHIRSGRFIPRRLGNDFVNLLVQLRRQAVFEWALRQPWSLMWRYRRAGIIFCFFGTADLAQILYMARDTVIAMVLYNLSIAWYNICAKPDSA